MAAGLWVPCPLAQFERRQDRSGGNLISVWFAPEPLERQPSPNLGGLRRLKGKSRDLGGGSGLLRPPPVQTSARSCFELPRHPQDFSIRVQTPQIRCGRSSCEWHPLRG